MLRTIGLVDTMNGKERRWGREGVRESWGGEGWWRISFGDRYYQIFLEGILSPAEEVPYPAAVRESCISKVRYGRSLAFSPRRFAIHLSLR